MSGEAETHKIHECPSSRCRSRKELMGRETDQAKLLRGCSWISCTVYKSRRKGQGCHFPESWSVLGWAFQWHSCIWVTPPLVSNPSPILMLLTPIKTATVILNWNLVRLLFWSVLAHYLGWVEVCYGFLGEISYNSVPPPCSDMWFRSNIHSQSSSFMFWHAFSWSCWSMGTNLGFALEQNEMSFVCLFEIAGDQTQCLSHANTRMVHWTTAPIHWLWA